MLTIKFVFFLSMNFVSVKTFKMFLFFFYKMNFNGEKQKSNLCLLADSIQTHLNPVQFSVMVTSMPWWRCWNGLKPDGEWTFITFFWKQASLYASSTWGRYQPPHVIGQAVVAQWSLPRILYKYIYIMCKFAQNFCLIKDA